ncbi:MAG TPA: hypothetical protein VHY31_03710 [Streptosporangiaceae bacterium]|jgi:hypothetical protein|nr:hypothetical protein [Streptosporangiaceae bacterium]
MKRRQAPALAALAATATVVMLAVTGCGSSRTVHAQTSFGFSGSRLVIDAGGSDLRVVAGGGPGVGVQRWVSGTAAKPGHASWTLAGDTLRLSIDCAGLVFSCGSRFQVAVPRGVAVVVHSGSGQDTVSGLSGPVVIDGSNGQVRLGDVSGPLQVSTGSGDVTASGIRSAAVRVNTNQGSVDIGFAAAPQSAEITCGTGNATARLPLAGYRYRVLVTSGTGAARSRVPDDPASSRLVRVSSSQGTATVLPAA